MLNILLVRAGAISGLVQHQWRGSSVVQEIDAGGDAVVVRAHQHAVKKRNEVDGGAVEGAIGIEDSGNSVVVGLGIIADNGGVDKEGEEGVLVGGVIVL